MRIYSLFHQDRAGWSHSLFHRVVEAWRCRPNIAGHRVLVTIKNRFLLPISLSPLTQHTHARALFLIVGSWPNLSGGRCEAENAPKAREKGAVKNPARYLFWQWPDRSIAMLTSRVSCFYFSRERSVNILKRAAALFMSTVTFFRSALFWVEGERHSGSYLLLLRSAAQLLLPPCRCQGYLVSGTFNERSFYQLQESSCY